jgi:predicted O-methyltransferase YrrM
MKYNNQIPGWMWETDLKILSALAENVVENGNILEIGSFLGRSTSALFYSKLPSVNLTIVDSFEINDRYNIFMNNYFRLSQMQGDEELFLSAQKVVKSYNSFFEGFKHCLGEEIYSQIDINVMHHKNYVPNKKFDMVFIDGDHSFKEVTGDISKYIDDEALIAGDDFHSVHPDIAKALTAIRRLHPSTLIVPENAKVWIMVPPSGRWNKLFRENNFCFFD